MISRRLKLPAGMIALLSLLVMSVFAVAGFSGHVSADPATVCRVVISLDRSGSVGRTNWNVLRDQVRQLADPVTGLTYAKTGKNIEIAFWTFSETSPVTTSGGFATTDFNAPHSNQAAPNNGFINLNDPLASTNLSNAIPAEKAESDPGPDNVIGGLTNYAQGLGYEATGSLPTLTFYQNSAVKDIASQANVIVMLTDGIPNYPGGYDFVSLPKEAGYQARQKYVSQGTAFVGGFISETPDFVPPSLTYTLNGNENPNPPNIGPVSFNGGVNSGIADYLIGRNPDGSDGAISKACPDQVVTSYNLQPIVHPQDVVVTSGQQPKFDYSVKNTTANTGTSGWQIFDVIINAGTSVGPNPFACGGTPYCSGITDCTTGGGGILGLIGGSGNGSCQASADNGGNGNSGSGNFPADVTSIYTGREATVTNIDDLPPGTRICRVLKLTNATNAGGTRVYGECATIGKTPLVQIHGGEVRAGRHFNTDTDSLPTAQEGIYTSRFGLKSTDPAAPNGLTFGSWTEYGVLSPGPILGMASLSGYATPSGGYINPASVSSSGCYRDTIGATNRLTFSNIGASECGHLDQNTMGLIPDVVSPLTSGSSTSIGTPFSLSASSAPGLYKYGSSTAGIQLDASTITANLSSTNNTYVIYAPNQTLTINGDIIVDGYSTQTYERANQVPQIVIIAKNININRGVKHIDAWLVAYQGDNSTLPGGGSDGTIDTCADFPRPLKADACPDTLTVNGPVMARQLKLWRTTVYTSSCTIDGSIPLTDPANCSHAVGNPGEVFNLTASSILWALSRGNASRIQTTYTTELPPYY